MKDENKAATATGGAIGLSAFASFVGLCCIGPWAVTLFGISGAIGMARWQPYRPYILATALIMIAWAFWRVYKPKPLESCESDVCQKGPSIWLKSSLWISLFLVVLAFFADELQWLLVDPTPTGLKQ